MKVLLIGYGSIGRRHEEVLQSLYKDSIIEIVTKQEIENKTCYNSLEKVKNLDNYDYFVIASETSKHFEQIVYLEQRVTDKIIFCEKPLFNFYQDQKIVKNRIFVGYVLRFHPLFKKFQELIKDQKIININVSCGQYLPTWRSNIDYKESYSAKKDLGGGVLLDLSHEIDYIQWLFGKINKIKSFQEKISDLEIDSDDFVTMIGVTDRGVFITLTIDYISKLFHRKIFVNTNNCSFELDLINNTIIQKDIDGKFQNYSFEKLQRNDLFYAMHKDILSREEENICDFTDALDVMKTISTIQEQNKNE